MGHLVGISGYAGSGKDEAAKALIQRGFNRVAFADVLRDVAYAIDPFVNLAQKENDFRTVIRLKELIDNKGWDYAKNTYPDVRRLLQRLGTEGGRQILGDNIWVETALSRAEGDTVITDVRFPNEAEAILDRGGALIRITRPGVGPRNDHASENALENFPFPVTINNGGTIAELHERVRTVVENELGLILA